MRGDTVFVMSQQIKPKFWTLSCKLWSIIITGLHNASEESSSLLRNPDTNTKLNFSSESKLCCCGHWVYLYLKWRPAVSMQIPMALNSTQHFSGDTSVLHSIRNLKRNFFVFQYLYSFCWQKTCSFSNIGNNQQGECVALSMPCVDCVWSIKFLLFPCHYFPSAAGTKKHISGSWFNK